MVAGDVRIAEEGVDSPIPGRLIGRDRCSILDMRKQEAIGRFLVPFPARSDDEAPSIPLDHAESDPFGSAPPSAMERLIGLDESFEHRAHIHEIPSKAAIPAPYRDMREAGDLDSRGKGHLLLPADDEEPKVALRDLHAGEPGDTRQTERFPAFRTAIPPFGPEDLA